MSAGTGGRTATDAGKQGAARRDTTQLVTSPWSRTRRARPGTWPQSPKRIGSGAAQAAMEPALRPQWRSRDPARPESQDDNRP